MSVDSLEPTWRTVYFHPGKILFHVTGRASRQDQDDIVSNANKFASAKGFSFELSRPRPQVFPPASYPSPGKQQGQNPPEKPEPRKSGIRPQIVEREAFSLIYADVRNPQVDGTDIYADDSNSKGDKMLLEFITSLDENRNDVFGEVVQVVSPSWLTGGSPRPGGTGGPGGRPLPYRGLSNNTEYLFYPPPISEEFESGDGEGVVVAILDTAPYPESWLEEINSVPDSSVLEFDPEEWDYIYDEWVTGRQHDPHSLIHTLLDPKDRRLTIYPDSRVMEAGFRDEVCIDHDYEMNDHGLFVAGIVHSLAPQAELHLFQVLTHYGIGDLEIIGDALKRVIDMFSDRPLVVNLSLNLGIPSEEKHIRVGRRDVEDSIGEELMRHKKRPGKETWFDRMAQPFEAICDLIYALNSRVIAAAGNDNDIHKHKNRPGARYPAAFDRVVGVGALGKNPTKPTHGSKLKTASYSNLADKPKEIGITTLGGEEGIEKGVLGVYVGEFPVSNDNPNPSPNTNGWAEWSGTSFATPIISGLTAAVLSRLIGEDPQATTQQAIEILFESDEIETESDEDAILIFQHYPNTP